MICSCVKNYKASACPCVCRGPSLLLEGEAHLAQHLGRELRERPPRQEVGRQVGDVHEDATTLERRLEVVVARRTARAHLRA